MSRHVLVALVLCAGATAGSAARAAPLPDDAPSARVAIDTSALGEAAEPIAEQVDVGLTFILKSQGLRRVEDDTAPEVRLTVTPLADDQPGYRVGYVVWFEGAEVEGSAGVHECNLCTEGELVTTAQAAVEDVLVPLRELGAAPKPEPTPAPEPPPTAAEETTGTDTRARPGRLGPVGKAGVALAVVGGAALVPGIALAVLPPKPLPMAERRNTFVPGVALAVAGGAVLATGVALIVVDSLRARRRTARGPVWSPLVAVRGDLFGLNATGRF